MKTFYITLEPLEPYFFGVEKMAEAGNRNNYYQKSAFYPQQTAILGMLRFLVGSKLGFDKLNIGESSFDAANNSIADYGYIKSISPIFIERNNHKYFEMPLDYDFKVEFRPNQKLFFNQNQKNNMPLVKNYSAKEGINYKLISKNRDTIPLKFDNLKPNDGVFWELPRDGNEKARDGKSKDSGFYKFEYVRMNNACFGFYASFDDASNLQQGQIEYIYLGGEKSPFKLSFQEISTSTDAWKAYLAEIPTNNYSKIILMSDTYIDPEIVKKADFSITELVSFRNLKTSLSKTKNWSGLSRNRKDDKQPHFSEKLNLLKKGSVLYFLDDKTCEEIENEIKSHQNFQQIGYNLFIVINKTQHKT